MKKTCIIIILGLILIPRSSCLAHASADGPFFNRAGLQIHGATVIPHDPGMHHLSRGNFPLYQLTLSGQTRGEKAWHHLYNFPHLGFDFLFGDLGYSEVLGTAFAFFPHIQTELAAGKTLRLALKHGIGLAYLTRPFEAEKNEENVAIGTAMNIALHSSLDLHWQISAAWGLQAGIALTHFSNGKIETPNKGLNIPSLKLGITHEYAPYLAYGSVVVADAPRQEWLVVTAGGFTASYPPGSGRSARYSLASTFNQPISARHKLGIGYDFFFSYPEIKADISGNPFVNHGVHVSFQQDYSRMSFIVHNGFYLWDKAGEREYLLYHRAGLRYSLTEKILLNVTLKTHLFQAEFAEWGLGYRLF